MGSNTSANFLFFRRASSGISLLIEGEPVMPHISFREDRYAVILRRILWPGWRWSNVPPTVMSISDVAGEITCYNGMVLPD
jgi:hypothetical protein